MFIICEDTGAVINPNNVFQYSVEFSSCKNCESFMTCQEAEMDHWIITAVPVGCDESTYALGSYSTEEYAYDALCYMLAELEDHKEGTTFVRLMAEDMLVKRKKRDEKLRREAERRPVYNIQLDPLKWPNKHGK